MPVYIEKVATPSPQDRTDLAKIYADAPTWLLAPHASADELIAAGIERGTLVAARFNDRLLGAALLEKGENRWLLSHLCVRKITRRRGVAQRLLDEALRIAVEDGKPLHLGAPRDQLESQAFAAHVKLPLESL